MGKQDKSECCERYKTKGKNPCKDCSKMARLSKKQRKKLLAKYP